MFQRNLLTIKGTSQEVDKCLNFKDIFDVSDLKTQQSEARGVNKMCLRHYKCLLFRIGSKFSQN